MQRLGETVEFLETKRGEFLNPVVFFTRRYRSWIIHVFRIEINLAIFEKETNDSLNATLCPLSRKFSNSISQAGVLIGENDQRV